MPWPGSITSPLLDYFNFYISHLDLNADKNVIKQ